MEDTFTAIKELVAIGKVRISDHGYDELAADNLTVRDILAGLANGQVVEDYPDYPKGPCVLLLQYDGQGRPVHVVWGIPAGYVEPAVVVTAYRPDPRRWTDDFKRRRP